MWAVRKYKPYIERYHFTAITDHFTAVADHFALKWLLKLDFPSGRWARWYMELLQYDFKLLYRKGTLNRVANTLSWQPVEPHSDGPTTDEAEAADVTRSQARKISDEAQNPGVPTVHSEEDKEPREPLVQRGVWESFETKECYTKLLEASSPVQRGI